jgi:hypothetical protein
MPLNPRKQVPQTLPTFSLTLTLTLPAPTLDPSPKKELP